MLKNKLKHSARALLGEDRFEYLKIWHQINIEIKYFTFDASFWEKPLFIHIPKTAGNSIYETAEVSSVMGHKSLQFYEDTFRDEVSVQLFRSQESISKSLFILLLSEKKAATACMTGSGQRKIFHPIKV